MLPTDEHHRGVSLEFTNVHTYSDKDGHIYASPVLLPILKLLEARIHTHTDIHTEGEMLQGRRGRGSGRDLNNLPSLYCCSLAPSLGSAQLSCPLWFFFNELKTNQVRVVNSTVH